MLKIFYCKITSPDIYKYQQLFFVGPKTFILSESVSTFTTGKNYTLSYSIYF